MDSIYIGKRIKFRDCLGEWTEAKLIEVIEELGSYVYRFSLDNGDTFDISQSDITGIIIKEKKKLSVAK